MCNYAATGNKLGPLICQTLMRISMKLARRLGGREQFWLEWNCREAKSLGIWNYSEGSAVNAAGHRVEVLEVAKGRQRDDVVSRTSSS